MRSVLLIDERYCHVVTEPLCVCPARVVPLIFFYLFICFIIIYVIINGNLLVVKCLLAALLPLCSIRSIQRMRGMVLSAINYPLLPTS